MGFNPLLLIVMNGMGIKIPKEHLDPFLEGSQGVSEFDGEPALTIDLPKDKYSVQREQKVLTQF